ncbi:laminin B domain-containing protein [Aequorivita marina]|uniref:laminin B domain-containing protein n=1 Tax=Aequorivita marina TaxID=3073654 RepID=UPI0028750C17|nr:laminin B domain-containing protein [Aequorivita sp. S2608]MDS1298502.1 laminin B domain-containing protein [Aequorivita sp. S2608]
MKKYSQVTLMGFFSLLLLASCNNETVSSYFKKNSENWTIEGDAQGEAVEPTYYAEDGMVNGYIEAKDDAAGGVWYFSAPEKYLGDKNTLYGRTLSYALFQKPKNNNQFDSPDVVLTNGENEIFYLVKDYPDTTWTHYEVKIDAEQEWFYGAYKDREVATEAQIKQVLSNLDKFWIRGEYRNGNDWGGLDEVIIK